jgi:predicted PurR-regulated permease PerM
MNLNKKKLSIYLIIFNICIVGFYSTVSYLNKLTESKEFLQSYMQTNLNIEKIILTEDIELLKKALQVSNEKTKTVFKLSQDLTGSITSVFILNSVLFFILFSINLYFIIFLQRKVNHKM